MTTFVNYFAVYNINKCRCFQGKQSIDNKTLTDRRVDNDSCEMAGGCLGIWLACWSLFFAVCHCFLTQQFPSVWQQRQNVPAINCITRFIFTDELHTLPVNRRFAYPCALTGTGGFRLVQISLSKKHSPTTILLAFVCVPFPIGRR